MWTKLFISALFIAAYIITIRLLGKRKRAGKKEPTKLSIKGIEIEYEDNEIGRERFRQMLQIIGEVYQLEQVSNRDLEYSREYEHREDTEYYVPQNIL